MKKVAVLFSSGLDSTYLVWKNLIDGNIVTPIYVDIQNNEVKTILEKNRIKLLYEEFCKEFNVGCDYSSEKIRPIQYLLSTSVQANEDSLHFKQVPIWIFALVFSQGLNVDEIQIGYVSNDDVIPYLSDIKKIYKSYKKISDKLIPLKFPLRKEKKYMMANKLPNKYLNLVFSCEDATIIGSVDAEKIEYEPCCECIPCRTIIASNYYEKNYFPENYRKNLKRYYARQLERLDCKVYDHDGKKISYWGVEEELVSSIDKNFEPYQLTIQFPPDLKQFKSPRISCKEIDN